MPQPGRVQNVCITAFNITQQELLRNKLQHRKEEDRHRGRGREREGERERERERGKERERYCIVAKAIVRGIKWSIREITEQIDWLRKTIITIK